MFEQYIHNLNYVIIAIGFFSFMDINDMQTNRNHGKTGQQQWELKIF